VYALTKFYRLVTSWRTWSPPNGLRAVAWPKSGIQPTATARFAFRAGFSGSGKSSLVFDTIAAESQRFINETYRAFVQGFMGDAGERPRSTCWKG
jgi:hypothetical protein